jgi:hypothetical protein
VPRSGCCAWSDSLYFTPKSRILMEIPKQEDSVSTNYMMQKIDTSSLRKVIF